MRSALTATLPHTRTRAILLFGLYASVQLADGALTFSGIQRFGVVAEGNPLLQFAMTHGGVGGTLLTAKSVAVALGAALFLRRQHLILAILTLLYVLAAVCPWATLTAI